MPPGVQWHMRRAWLGVVVVSVACGSAPLKKPDLAALEAADAQVLQGCYDCLLDAHATYDRLAVREGATARHLPSL